MIGQMCKNLRRYKCPSSLICRSLWEGNPPLYDFLKLRLTANSHDYQPKDITVAILLRRR